MDADLILSDARIDDHGRPVPLQPDTPTPAPALTDEQMGSSPADDAQIDDDVRALVEGESMPEETAEAIIAAVIARAKREAAEEIAAGIETMPIAGFNGETLKWLKVAREMCAALARKVGADHA